MRVAELSLRNYRVYEELDLELPARVIGIFGPNGSGKSTIVESILWALYGRARTAKSEIRTQGLLTDCEVRLVFEHGGSQYEVRRWIRGKNHATGVAPPTVVEFLVIGPKVNVVLTAPLSVNGLAWTWFALTGRPNVTTSWRVAPAGRSGVGGAVDESSGEG